MTLLDLLFFPIHSTMSLVGCAPSLHPLAPSTSSLYRLFISFENCWGQPKPVNLTLSLSYSHQILQLKARMIQMGSCLTLSKTFARLHQSNTEFCMHNITDPQIKSRHFPGLELPAQCQRVRRCRRLGWNSAPSLSSVHHPCSQSSQVMKEDGQSSFHVCGLWGLPGVPHAFSSRSSFIAFANPPWFTGQSCYPYCTDEETAIQKALWPAKGHTADSGE